MASYQRLTWTGLVVDSPYPAVGAPIGPLPDEIPHITPSSPLNYAYSSNGVASFTINQGFGDLFSFMFACSTPGGLKVPQVCSLTVSAKCADYGGDRYNTEPSASFTYNPAGPFDGNMTYARWPISNNCTDFNFVATYGGSPIALELDDVSYTN